MLSIPFIFSLVSTLTSVLVARFIFRPPWSSSESFSKKLSPFGYFIMGFGSGFLTMVGFSETLLSFSMALTSCLSGTSMSFSGNSTVELDSEISTSSFSETSTKGFSGTSAAVGISRTSAETYCQGSTETCCCC